MNSLDSWLPGLVRQPRGGTQCSIVSFVLELVIIELKCANMVNIEPTPSIRTCNGLSSLLFSCASTGHASANRSVSRNSAPPAASTTACTGTHSSVTLLSAPISGPGTFGSDLWVRSMVQISHRLNPSHPYSPGIRNGALTAPKKRCRCLCAFHIPCAGGSRDTVRTAPAVRGPPPPAVQARTGPRVKAWPGVSSYTYAVRGAVSRSQR